MRRPQLSASDSDHMITAVEPEDEADVAELIEQVGNSDSAEEHAQASAVEDGDQHHSLFSADEPR
jgi:hypothetical protein